MPLASTTAPFMPGAAMLRVLSIVHVRADFWETEPHALVSFLVFFWFWRGSLHRAGTPDEI